jgi:hypothetical protein
MRTNADGHVTPAGSRLARAVWETAKGIAAAKRLQGPKGRASGRDRANRGLPIRAAKGASWSLVIGHSFVIRFLVIRHSV